jgi:uncharacterized protein (TIGR00369 family)
VSAAPASAGGFDIVIPFADLLGVRCVSQAPGHVVTSLALRPELENSWGVAHGGVTMSLLDVTLGMAAKAVDVRATGSVTVELKVNFLAAARGTLTGEGFARRAGRSLVFAEGELRDADGAVTAKATGTFKLRLPRTDPGDV